MMSRKGNFSGPATVYGSGTKGVCLANTCFGRGGDDCSVGALGLGTGLGLR